MATGSEVRLITSGYTPDGIFTASDQSYRGVATKTLSTTPAIGEIFSLELNLFTAPRRSNTKPASDA